MTESLQIRTTTNIPLAQITNLSTATSLQTPPSISNTIPIESQEHHHNHMESSASTNNATSTTASSKRDANGNLINEQHQPSGQNNLFANRNDNWNYLQTFYNETDLQTFFQNRVQSRTNVTHRNKGKCSICKYASLTDEVDHEMIIIYRACVSKNCTDKCAFKYKIISCVNSPSVFMCYKNSFPHHLRNSVGRDDGENEVDNYRGLHPKLKVLITEMINANILRPKKIHQLLDQKRHLFEPAIKIPTVAQIHSFVQRVKAKQSQNDESNTTNSGPQIGLDINTFLENHIELISDSNNLNSTSTHQNNHNVIIIDSATSGGSASKRPRLDTSLNKESSGAAGGGTGASEPSLNDAIKAMGTLKQFLKNRISKIQTTLENLSRIENFISDNFNSELNLDSLNIEDFFGRK
jgi:hypothetical protein